MFQKKELIETRNDNLYPVTPERLLIYKLLENALREYETLIKSSNKRKQQSMLRLEEWAFTPRYYHIFSLQWCCEMITSEPMGLYSAIQGQFKSIKNNPNIKHTRRIKIQK